MRLALPATALAAFIFFPSAACAEHHETSTQATLSQAELEAQHSRTRRIEWTGKAGRIGTTTFSAKGTAVLGMQGASVEGSWRIKGDTFCTTYPTMGEGGEQCLKRVRVDEDTYRAVAEDGSVAAEFKFTN